MNQDDYRSHDSNPKPIPPKSWLVESILATLFCCLPFGVVGIVNAAKVETAFYAGRIGEAEMASRNAKKWTLLSFWIGIAAALIYGIIIAVGMIFGISGSIFNAFVR